MSVDEVLAHYQRLGREVFRKDWLRHGVLRARHDETALIGNLKRVFGEQLTLGDPAVKTGLLIMTKRLDTGSPWPLGNNTLLTPERVNALVPDLPADRLRHIGAMDDPDNLGVLLELGDAVGREQVVPAHFGARFDLLPPIERRARGRYVKRANSSVVAVA